MHRGPLAAEGGLVLHHRGALLAGGGTAQPWAEAGALLQAELSIAGAKQALHWISVQLNMSAPWATEGQGHARKSQSSRGAAGAASLRGAA